ncbi:hypothetical protein V6N13_130550 [Hibiscus sabdariffa]
MSISSPDLGPLVDHIMMPREIIVPGICVADMASNNGECLLEDQGSLLDRCQCLKEFMLKALGSVRGVSVCPSSVPQQVSTWLKLTRGWHKVNTDGGRRVQDRDCFLSFWVCVFVPCFAFTVPALERLSVTRCGALWILHP